MRNSLLLVAVLLLPACGHNPPAESIPQSRSSLPEVVQTPPPASTEGSLTKSLQASQNELQSDSIRLLQSFHDAMLNDLAETLSRARKLLQPSAPAAPGH